MTRSRKPPRDLPAWQTAKPGKLPLPPKRGRNKNYGSKRWFWPMSQAELDAWRAKRAADYAATNPEQLELFSHMVAAFNAAEAHRQWLDRVRTTPPRRRPQR